MEVWGARGDGDEGPVTGGLGEAAAGGGGGVLSPELEAAFDAEGGEEVGVDGGREPLQLGEKGAVLVWSWDSWNSIRKIVR